jgi:hypothetical protein
VALSPDILDCAVWISSSRAQERGGDPVDLNPFVEGISLIVWAAQHLR